MSDFLITAIISFVLALISGVILIPILHRLKFGQEIREEGPKWHKAKSGTPTMGGIIFILSYVIAIVIFSFIKDMRDSYKALLLVSASALSFGGIGFIDDYIKVILKRNLGLTAKQKFTLQLLVSLLFTGLMAGSGVIDMSVYIPFFKTYLNLGYLVLPLDILVMLATVNSVNLTDGLDGLATSVTIVVALFFAMVADLASNNVVIIITGAIIGGLFGFLIYNRHPAKVFMGDTGSLFLGGAVCGMAFVYDKPLILLLVGIVYIVEALSVILQVSYFKLTHGKRLFKMSPIHHHFEMCGWNEKKVCFVFMTVSAIGAALGFAGIATTLF